MKFDAKDIGAVANSRYMRRVGNRLMLLMVGLVFVGFGGAMLAQETAFRLFLCVVTVLCVVVAVWAMDKGQKRERIKLLKEWNEESKKQA